MRVGGNQKLSVDARLVCATLRPLEQDVHAGRFRADLFYRIQGVALVLPPLRERTADIGPLVHQFVAELSAKHSVRPPKLSRAALAALKNYPWPGNIRELRNMLELVCLLRPGKPVRPHDLPAAIRGYFVSIAPASPRIPTGRRLDISLDEPLKEILDRVLLAALELEEGNRSRVARRLGISLRTVQRHLDRIPAQSQPS